MPTQAKTFQNYLDALDALAVFRQGRPDMLIEGATCDSREVRSGWLFVAIPGAREDGTRYVQAALRAGASAVVSTVPLTLPEGVAHVQVADAYAAAALVAEVLYDFPSRGLRLLGITGTNGKTTSAFLLRDILARAGRRVGMVGTVHYDIGGKIIPADRTTPPPFILQKLFRQMCDAGIQDVVLEASSHALEQRRAGTATFAGAIFTNLTGDHLDYHQTMDNYFAAKRILFSQGLARGVPAVLNGDDAYGAALHQQMQSSRDTGRPVSFGCHAGSDVRMTDIDTSVRGGRMVLDFGTAPSLELSCPMIGLYNLYNVAGVAVLARQIGIDDEIIREAVAAFTGAPGRLEPVYSPNGASVFVDYAHTDDALHNVLSSLRALKPARLSVVFGCGGDRDRSKRPRMGRVAAELADRVYVTSDNPRTEDPDAIIADIVAGIVSGTDTRVVSDRREAIRTAIAEAQAGEIVLVAGKGHETYQEQNGVRRDFDDIREVRLAMGL